MREQDRAEPDRALSGALSATAVWFALITYGVSVAAAQGITGPGASSSPSAAAVTSGAPTAAGEGSAPARSRGLRPPKVVVSPKAHARAAELTNEAQAHYDAGRYDEAAESYRQAYAVVPAPELLFNLGQCQRLMGRPQRAVKYFEAYLRLRPDAPHRALVEQLIEESRLIGTPDPALAPTEPPAVSSNGPAGEGKPAQPAQRVHNANVMPLPPPEPLHDANQPTRLLADDRYDNYDSPALYERWWFWTAIAVVAAGAAVTTYAVVASHEDKEPPPMTTLGMIAWD